MKIAAICCVLALAGCATSRVVTQTVDVPVPVIQKCPTPVIPARPHLPIAGLTSRSAPADVERAYVESVSLLEGYAAQLEALLGQ